MLLKIIKLSLYLGVVFIFIGCASTSEKVGILPKEKELSDIVKSEAIVILSIEERFLTRPHAAYVYMRNKTEKGKGNFVGTTDIAQREQDLNGGNFLGNHAIYAVPEGTYSIEGWRYRYFKDVSAPMPHPVEFNFEKGKIYYIGRFYTVALDMSLSLKDNYKEDIMYMKQKYPYLNNAEIVNLSKDKKFDKWYIGNVHKELEKMMKNNKKEK